jgi:hypothetical protein
MESKVRLTPTGDYKAEAGEQNSAHSINPGGVGSTAGAPQAGPDHHLSEARVRNLDRVGE